MHLEIKASSIQPRRQCKELRRYVQQWSTATRMEANPVRRMHFRERSIRAILDHHLYVNDCLITSANSQEVQKTKHEIQQKFKTEDLGEASSVLGQQINHDKTNGLLCIDPEKYATAVLGRFNMKHYNAFDSPIDEKVTGEADNRK